MFFSLENCLANPKSHNFNKLFSDINMFSGFISLCNILALWILWVAISNCYVIFLTYFLFKPFGYSASKSYNNVLSTYSNTNYNVLFNLKTSNKATIELHYFKDLNILISRNAVFLTFKSVSCSLNFFIATNFCVGKYIAF